MYVFKRFKIIELIDKLNVDFNGEKEDDKKEKHHHHPLKKKISDKIKINEIVAKTFSLVRYAKFLCFGSYNCYYVKYPLIQRAHPNIKPHFELIMNIPAFLHCFYKCFFSFITTRLLILKLMFI